ncbi:uncharacterized protein LOC114528481 [Dendronephthya gigantea]|uniref:uncharacterized protein LOC114528481 n=1 Tax=Dendronephthya gigantea TaxID=151771 RepID=UPI00106B5F9D|nr:uncharacterized protein LOC114528481 [Dendronephthya gigantea]
MFFSRNRRKSEKRSGKKEKGSDADLSIKVCKHNTITKSRTTAGSSSQATTILISEQKIGENQNKTKSLNTVEHCVNIRTISSHVANSSDSITSHATSGSSSDGVGDEEKPNRRTYSLEQVSKSLDQVMASGKAILDALASVNSKECGKNSDGNGIFDASGTKNERDLTKRGTYDLGDVSELLDASVASDSSLVVSLNHVSQELPNKGTSTSNIKRKTYELEAVSTRLDQSYVQNTSVEDMLYDLSQDASHNSQNDSLSNSNLKRETYDLEKIETALDESLNGDVEQTEESETGTKPTFNMNRRGTYDLTDVSSQLDHASDMSALLDNSEKNAANEPSLIMTRRNTYNLNDVSDLLDESGSDKSVQESLDKISSEKLKRKTYDLTDIDLGLIEQSIDGHMLENNNTVTAEKQLYAGVIGKSECGPSDLDDSLTEVGSESKKRNTYVHEDSNLPEDNSNSNKLADVLSEFSLDNEDGVERHDVGLTPCQWIDQMDELKPPPTLTKPPTLSPLKLKLKPKKVGASKASKHISDDTAQLKLRSQSISGVLDLKSSAEIQPRSINDSKTVSQLKSNSEPNLVTSTPKASNVSKSEGIEMDISPGIRNYLANKLGLSEEQCLAVHRRLSGSGVETLPDATKFANRKTYSLDDVAQSLDIATSQGLPMTKVLDNLDTENTEDDTNIAHESITKQRTDSDSNNLEVGNTTAQVENSLLSPPKPQTLDLESATQKSSSDQKTRIPASGSSFVNGSPTAKVSPLEEQFKLVRKKAVYKPSAKLQSFSHLLGGKGSLVPLRRTRGKNDPLKRNTYTLESVAESLEKAQDAGVPMLDALKRLSGSCQSAPSELPAEKRRTYNLEDLSNTLETAAAEGVTIVDTLRTIADPLHQDDSGKDVVASDETLRRQDEIFESSKTPDSVPQTTKSSPKKKAPPKPKRTFSNSSKHEIKFVSDSFVIEYYTSPPAKRSQSDSSVQDLKSGNRENDCVENEEKYHAYINHNILAETIAAGGETPELSAASQSGKDKGTSSIRKDGKPTARVVNDLDSLIMRLAAEVEKPTSVDIIKSKSRKSIPSSACIDHDVSSSSKAPESSNEKASPSTKEGLPDTESNLSETKPEFPSTKRDFSSTNLSFQNTEPWLPSTKLDDEGYCSLSRKPGTRSISLETSLDDLSKKEKLVTTVEEDDSCVE